MTGTDGLSLTGCFQIVQDAITEHMGRLKIDGVTVKQKYNAFWVFVKTKVKLLKRIDWGDNVTVSCFISNISLAKMHIDVQVKDKSKQTALYSRTEICALDIATQKIIKIASVGVKPSMAAKKRAADIAYSQFDDPDLPVVGNVRIKSTNIDFSHHTNNSEYIRLIRDTYTVAETEAKKVRETEINYVSQSYEGDVLDIKKASFADRDIIVLEKDGKPVVKCKITF